MAAKVRLDRRTSWRSRRWLLSAGVLLAITIALFVLFPGRRLGLAFTLATGIGTPSLQAEIDALETKAIRRSAFSVEEKAFLSDLYRTLATGARLTIIVRQTANLMDHYLDGSGAEYRLDPEIFTGNAKVSQQMSLLRARATATACGRGFQLSSGRFHMPDSSKIDSVFGLYYGTLSLVGVPATGGACRLRWRAEVPWNWPSYPSLKQKYGNFHAESFPLPNLKSLVFGMHESLFIDNGLGEYLVHLGLAQPFLAFAEWDD